MYSTGDKSHRSYSHPRTSGHQTRGHHAQTATICQQCRKPCASLVNGSRCERCAQPCRRKGCPSPRYYDPELGVFKYCSPQCRNEHYLPWYDRKVKVSLGQSKESDLFDDPLESSSSSTLRQSSSLNSIASLTLDTSTHSYSPQTPYMYSPQPRRRLYNYTFYQ